MELLKYIFHLGIIFIVFSIIWGFFMIIYRMLTGMAQRPLLETYAFKTLNLYFIVSLCAMLTVEYISKPGAPRILITIIGITVLYSYFAGRLQQSKILVQMNNLRVSNERINLAWESTLILAALVYFSFGITRPDILNNDANLWFSTSVKDLYDTIIIGWIISFFGILMLIVNLVRSVVVTANAINWVIDRISGKQNNDSDSGGDGYTDYEEIKDEQIDR